MSRRRNTEAELDALTGVCERLAGFDARVSVEWLDGYLSVLAAGPRVPELAQALDALPEDCWPRTFADPEDAQRALAALQPRWRVLLAQLDPESLWDDPDALHLAPLLLEPDADRGLRLGDGWVDGASAALDDPQWGWTPSEAAGDESYVHALARLRALAAPDPAGATDPQAREALVDDACYALQDLRLWWMVNAPRTAPRRVEAAPGRNDPCPCGSGRKFKKCHGAA